MTLTKTLAAAALSIILAAPAWALPNCINGVAASAPSAPDKNGTLFVYCPTTFVHCTAAQPNINYIQGNQTAANYTIVGSNQLFGTYQPCTINGSPNSLPGIHTVGGQSFLLPANGVITGTVECPGSALGSCNSFFTHP